MAAEFQVEDIMNNIRREIEREDRMAEDHIPDFEEIPIRASGESAAAGNVEDPTAHIDLDWPLLMQSLSYVNSNYVLQYYWSFGRGFKSFLKRFVRKLAKCILLPIVVAQSEWNSHVVRCLNQLRYYVESLLHENALRVQNIEALQHENAWCKEKIEALLHENALRVQNVEALQHENAWCKEKIETLLHENVLRVQNVEALQHENALRNEELAMLRGETQKYAETMAALWDRGLSSVEGELRREFEEKTEDLNRSFSQLLEKTDREREEQENNLSRRSAEIIERFAEQERAEQELQEQIDALNGQNAANSERFAEQERTDQGLQQQIDALNRQSDTFSASVAKAFLKVSRNDCALPAERQPLSAESPEPTRSESESSAYTAVDYFKFQNDFRGSRALITQRQEIYLPYFENCKKPVLDLGCGRGEFLQLLKNNRIPAYGIDLYPEYVAEGELNGLDVREGDGIAYLKKTTETFGGIFVGQVIEHISFPQLQTLCFSAYEKLEDGGCLILETPNPTCLTVYTGPFYIDPTHIRPVHPLLLDYVLKQAGFRETKTMFTDASRTDSPLPLIDADGIRNLDEVNAAIQKVSNLIYGSQDYAIIARK